MEAEIDEYGGLKIKRKGKLKDQRCPYQDEYSCCDCCPHFGEPQKEDSLTHLSYCGGVLVFDDLIDRRKQTIGVIE